MMRTKLTFLIAVLVVMGACGDDPQTEPGTAATTTEAVMPDSATDSQATTTTITAVPPPPTTLPSDDPTVQLTVASERRGGYDRDDWGPHRSSLCQGKVGTADPYTNTRIDVCNVDHVVALAEAHESGGWSWTNTEKQRFSQDPINHVASRACVNQSKSAHDIAEWSDTRISRSSACGGGYTVTPAGRCYLAEVTVTVKEKWGLTVDQAEANTLTRVLAGCGQSDTTFTPQTPPPTPTTTSSSPPSETEPDEACVISDRTQAEYDDVPGIGAALSERLAASQPFGSVADLDTVKGIGPVKANAVWDHFCP